MATMAIKPGCLDTAAGYLGVIVASDPMVWVDKGSVTCTQGMLLLLDYGSRFDQQGIKSLVFCHLERTAYSQAEGQAACISLPGLAAWLPSSYLPFVSVSR